MSNAPVTPPKATNVPQNSNIQVTPYNQGSSSRAENRESMLVTDVKDEILHDICDAPNPSIHDVILGLIRLMTRCNAVKADEILTACLKAVIPICNDNEKVIKKLTPNFEGEKISAAKNLRSSLKSYCQTSNEPERYPFFTRALNSILSAFRGANKDVGLPSDLPEWDSSLDILFHVNDPQYLVGSYADGDHKSSRKPDIVSILLRVANLAHGTRGAKDGWDAAVKKAESSEVKKWKNSEWWTWIETLQSWELKANKIIKLIGGELRRDYDTELLPGNKLRVPKSGLDKDSTEESTSRPGPSEQSTTRSASKTPAREPDDRSLRRSSRIKEVSASAPASGSGDGSGGSKRKASDSVASRGSSKKAKVGDSSPKRLHVSVQSALYGAERLCSHISIAYVTGMIVVDELAYFCWYDRQGCIRSTSLNFIENLPYFAILIILFGRFNKSHWGINTMLEDKSDFTIGDVSLRLKKPIYQRFSLVGRGTTTVEVGLAAPHELASEKLIVKLSFPEESRMNEKKIIDIARQKAEGTKRDFEVVDHIPHAFRSKDFPEYATSRIRELFGLSTKGSRIMRILLLRRCFPIVNLSPDDFWRAYWQIVQCHFRLWKLRIAHGDISVNNLMYDNHDGQIRGILNDFDLATIITGEVTPNHDRTGTTPFMALELLTDDGMKGEVKRLYRHDLESFAWVVLWIVASYNEAGERVDPLPFADWLDAKITSCRRAKIDFKLQVAMLGHCYSTFRITVRELARFWIDRYVPFSNAKELAGLTGVRFEPSEDREEDILRIILVLTRKSPSVIPQGLETLEQAEEGLSAEELALLAPELTT